MESKTMTEEEMIEKYAKLKKKIEQLEAEQKEIKEYFVTAYGVCEMEIAGYKVVISEVESERLGKKEDFFKAFGEQIIRDKNLITSSMATKFSVKEVK